MLKRFKLIIYQQGKVVEHDEVYKVDITLPRANLEKSRVEQIFEVGYIHNYNVAESKTLLSKRVVFPALSLERTKQSRTKFYPQRGRNSALEKSKAGLGEAFGEHNTLEED